MSYTMPGEDKLHSVVPSKDIICKDCAFRNDGTIWSNDYRKGCCQQFPYPTHKPMDVLFKHAQCSMYQKEKQL